MELILTNAKIYTPTEVIAPGTIVIEDGIIKQIMEGKVKDGIDLEGKIVAPGFIDTHIHGCYGFDTNNGESLRFQKMSKMLVRHGVTSFIPTTVTDSHENLLRISREVGKIIEEYKGDGGARILGLHLEGPYINPKKKGAQNPEYIRKPDFGEFMEYWKASNGNIREITIAPEVEGAIEFIENVTRLGVIVQLGHTNATYEEAKRAIIAGASKATHLFNAMRGIHHREVGVVGACLESENIYLEMICDLIHLSPQIIRLVYKLAGPYRITLVTDAISATGLPDGRYTLGGLDVIVQGGICRLLDGTLAGSTLTMDKAIKNLVNIGIPLRDALIMASYVPAKAIGESDIGILRPGYRADFVVLDNNLTVVQTYINGRLVFERDT
ncbi:N-acetylglucosamine-6-phosphate deacetylase [Thermococcus chitonophagus]|uniref:N-acetylglucosamine-6-phosphate deacetylase n=1 Tax=Thermococcus chitonophagus TaxID=54262 RepID=A0A160VRH5_9EURY|nr:N-acetylglucosamine-6-phosphate deacetylase [Thermococcus chitonophagus]ASJ16515.1 N-acetylglucosamine-6-phosphate deacetylase [Thermococcus chitonophagus]CUX77583.1 N-acetylglucosamine-6-phosphate deacetylase [Thermococcus chitonophagus]